MLTYGKHHVDEEDIQAVVKILKSGWLTQGPTIEKFEKAVASYVGAKYAVAVSNGTAGLHMAALAAEIKPGDQVITSPITFVASANCALYAGGSALFSDVEPGTVNICPVELNKTIEKQKHVRAIIPVHFSGLACEMDTIASIANQYNAVVIEDAAHALGSKYANGKMVGCCTNSLMTVFSFHPVKAITAGEGGMITTNDEIIYRKLLRLRSHGINKLDDPFIIQEQAFEEGEEIPWYYEMQEMGFNYRISDIQSGLALSQLKKLQRFISRRRELVSQYLEAFADVPFINPAQTQGYDISAHHLFVVRIDYSSIHKKRSQLMNQLKSKGIGTQVHYIPIPAHPYYRKLGFQPEDYPNALSYYQEALSIPLFYDLTDAEQCFVVDSLKEITK